MVADIDILSTSVFIAQYIISLYGRMSNFLRHYLEFIYQISYNTVNNHYCLK